MSRPVPSIISSLILLTAAPAGPATGQPSPSGQIAEFPGQQQIPPLPRDRPAGWPDMRRQVPPAGSVLTMPVPNHVQQVLGSSLPDAGRTDELIAAQTRAIKELHQKLAELEARLAKLEGNR